MILEIVFLLVLIISDFLLFIGASRKTPVELLPWLVSHGLFLGVQLVLVIYYLVTLFITSTPSTQNEWLGLPEGMTSKNPEFQQRLRWSLGITVAKLAVLVITSLITAFSWWIVFLDRQTLQAEVEHPRAEYSVKAEYRDDGGRRGSMNKVPARPSYRQPVGGNVYSIPGQEHTLEEGYTRQTSLDTTYNVPSIRSEVLGPVLTHFDSIAEAEEEGRRNQGFLL